MTDALLEYIKDIHEHPEYYCDKIKRLYLGIIEPITKGLDQDFYYDAKPGKKFVRFCQGDLIDEENLEDLLKMTDGKTIYDKMANLEKRVFCGFIRQHQGEWAGRPLILQPYQKAYIFTKYGIKWRKGHAPKPELDNKRRFQEVFMVVGRKNGKTTLQCAEALFSLFFEPGAEVYVAATTYQQARRLWNEAKAMVSSSPTLSSVLTSRVFPQAEIFFRQSKTKGASQNTSTFKCLSNNPRTQDGLNVSTAIIDECHELPRAVYDVIKMGTSARIDSFISLITTSGFLRGGLFDTEYEYADVILKGNGGSKTLLPIIYELDKGDDIYDEKNWVKANPTLGHIKKVAYMRDQMERAKLDLSTLSEVKTKDFNIIGVEKTAWLTAEDINQPTDYPDDESLRVFDYADVIGGFDLSRTGDCTAVTTLIFSTEKKKIIAHTMYWITRDFLQSDDCKRSAVPWQAWLDRGLVRIASDHIIPSTIVADYLLEEFQRHMWSYVHIGYDPYSSAELIEKLVSMGFSSEKGLAPEDRPSACLKAIRQGSQTLSHPMEILQALLKAKKLDYQGNPVTRWMLSNVQLVQDRNGNMMPDKRNNNSALKIDGVATILDALAVFSENIDGYLPGLFDDVPVDSGEQN